MDLRSPASLLRDRYPHVRLPDDMLEEDDFPTRYPVQIDNTENWDRCKSRIMEGIKEWWNDIGDHIRARPSNQEVYGPDIGESCTSASLRIDRGLE